MGGCMSANDDLPGLRVELSLIERALDAEIPYLGICLGAQLLARALGARVGPHPGGHAEIGYFPIYATPEGGELFAMGHRVYHWHMEGFELPVGAELLATGELFPNQAIRYGANAYGIQFHPEVTPEIMEDWLKDSPERLSLPGAQCPQTQRAHRRDHHEPLGHWLDRFLDRWLCVQASANCQAWAPSA
jgi:GMP synthase (glutamine-hydrolysing)